MHVCIYNRYDKLVGMFSASNQETPCVGVSIGVERVFTIMERKAESMGLMHIPNVQVFVAAIGGYLPERMRVARLLWSANISAEYSHQEDIKFKRQLDETLERNIPYMVVIGKDELSRGCVKVKDMKSHVEEEIPLDGLVAKLLSIGCLSLAVGTDTSLLEIMKQRA
jgi:histidyl-tRNA synthetase